MNNLILNERYESVSYFLERGKGEKIFIGNKALIDLSFCSGAIFLGHNNHIFKKSIKEYLNKEYSLFSNPNKHAVELAKSIKYFFPNFHRIVFCSTGSESVIKTLRISRAINKKKKIGIVAGGWHGSTDQTLFYANKNLKPKPLSGGLSEIDKKNSIFIPYNDIEKTKKILNKKHNLINCIIVEPVLGCLPVDNAGKYLKFLNEYCIKKNINLIFDEIITGFRTKGGSVQNKYNIKPDFTIIGKVLGGSLPIGAIGISKKTYLRMKKLKPKVFFGGTFSGNSFSSFIGNKTINHIKNNKKELNKLIANCEYFQKKINQFIKKNNIDARIYRFDSILRIVFSKKKIKSRFQRDFFDSKKKNSIKKFENFLFKKNIYSPPNGIILLSLVTTKKNINYLIKKICEGLYLYCKVKKNI